MQDQLLLPLELLKEFCISNYIKRDAEDAVACLSKDIHWFGTCDDEDVHNSREAEDYINHDIFKEPVSYRMEFLEESENIISSGLGTASVKIKIMSDGLSAVKRFTAVVRLEDGKNRICEMHTSVSEVNQTKEVYVPYESAWDLADTHACQDSREQKEIGHNAAEQNAAGRKFPDKNPGFVQDHTTKSFWKERRSTILVLSVVLVLIIAVVCFAVYLTRIQWKATTSTIETVSLAATECVTSEIQADRLILSDIAQWVGRSNSRDRAELLDGVQAETTFREIIAVFDNGTSCSSIGSSPEAIGRSLEQIEYPEGEDVSRPYYGTTGKKQVTYRRNIVTDGEKAGVVYGVVDLSKYYAPSVMEFYNGKGFSYVIDVQSGDFLIYTTRTMSQGAYRDFYTVLQESESEEEIQNLKQVLMSGKAGNTIINLLGTRTYLYFVPLEGGSNRYLITMVPYRVMRAESSGLVYIVVSFVAAVILAAGIVLFLNERMARTKAKERGYRAMLFHLLSENVDSVFFIYDTDAGRLDYVSENTMRILGIESREFTQDNFLKTSLMPESERLEQIRGFWKQKCNFTTEYAYCNPLTGKQQRLRLSGYIPSEKT